MLKLLKKEFALALHPAAPFFLLCAAMVLIPNYPYSVAFFYVTLGIFFTCLQGRENNDIAYSMNLPVAKKDLVKARFALAIILEAMQMIIMAPLLCLSSLINQSNAAGLDASPALYGVGFVVFGLFHLTYFTAYYKNVKKVGIPFVISSIITFIVVFIEIVLTFAVPFVGEKLDCTGLQNISEKLIFAGICFIFYLLATVTAYKTSVKSFEAQDL